jgi:hypothetical protein
VRAASSASSSASLRNSSVARSFTDTVSQS